MAVAADARMGPAHLMLEQRGIVSADLLAPDIYDSWMRCIALGLDTRRPPPVERASHGRLRQEQQEHGLVRGLALAEMHTLHQQIAGSNFMIAFGSPSGMLLDIVSDKSFDDTADSAGIQPGCLWTESHCGTNGLGTATHTKRPIVVQGGEHFSPAIAPSLARHRPSSGRTAPSWASSMPRPTACRARPTRRLSWPWPRPRSRTASFASATGPTS